MLRRPIAQAEFSLSHFDGVMDIEIPKVTLITCLKEHDTTSQNLSYFQQKSTQLSFHVTAKDDK